MKQALLWILGIALFAFVVVMIGFCCSSCARQEEQITYGEPIVYYCDDRGC